MFVRFAEQNLLKALDDTPVVLIHGSRQCGKTTLAQMVGEKHQYHYLTFDDVNQLNAAKSDPVGFVDNLPEQPKIEKWHGIVILLTLLFNEIFRILPVFKT